MIFLTPPKKVPLSQRHYGLVTRVGEGQHGFCSARWRAKEAGLALGRPWKGESATEGAIQSSTSCGEHVVGWFFE